jgi:glycyl-tRNA synthetase beta chain
MGSYYALAQGDEADVACAIKQHYQPRFSGDAIPSMCAGQLVSVADKMDTIAGVFAAGKAPRGTSDPFALRRSAIGILHIALQALPIDLDQLIRVALDHYTSVLSFDYEQTFEAIRAFFDSRFESLLRDEGYSYDVINAVLAVHAHQPADALARMQALEKFKTHDDMINLSTAFARAKNLAQPEAGTTIDAALLSTPERVLVDALAVMAETEERLLEQQEYATLLAHFANLRKPVDEFFDAVLIMDEDEQVRRNRLAILNTLVARIESFADLQQLVIKK